MDQQMAPAKRAAAEPLAERWHGTSGGYSNHGCRCRACKDAWALAHRAAAQRARGRPTPADVHGTTNGYGYWGCRCGDCGDAWRGAASRRRRQARGVRRARGGPQSQAVRAALKSWENTPDGTARTAPARSAFLGRFPDEDAKSRYFRALAQRSAAIRAIKAAPLPET